MAEVQPGAQPPWWRRHLLALTLVGFIVLLVYAAVAATVLPGWIVSMNAGAKADDNTRLNAIASTRGALLGVLAPLVIGVGAIAAYLNYRVAADNLAETAAQNRRTVELTRRGQLTERFTKAIDQLGQTGEDKLDVRLGGIYALEQIAKESKELHGPVMEILTAFLREHSRRHGTPSAPVLAEDAALAARSADGAAMERAEPRLRADFQAIATVLGRRPEARRSQEGDRRLDLGRVRLPKADLADAHLEKAIFDGAELPGLDLTGAKLQWAGFRNAQLQHADFTGAQLQNAYFNDAHLEDAILLGAQLEVANFSGADMDRAWLGIPGTSSMMPAV